MNFEHSFVNPYDWSQELIIKFSKKIMKHNPCEPHFLRNAPELDQFGLSPRMIEDAVTYVHDILDSIDEKLLEEDSCRLVELVELANFSAIMGNLFRNGIVKASNGYFEANEPHTYPDIIGVGDGCKDIEIKVALELNPPKGHLVKPGPHITVRYVLAKEDGSYKRGKMNRGNMPWIWEVRVGELREEHFNVSNTDGDSGKTAVINAAGMKSLGVVYFNFNKTPLSKSGKLYSSIKKTFETDDENSK